MNTSMIVKEKIGIEGGLGPIQAVTERIELEISPMTVFIGPQGTGKSLISQLLYFFRDAEYLLSQHYSERSGPEQAVSQIIDRIRAGKLPRPALASFLTTPRAKISYESQNQAALVQKRTIEIVQESNKVLPLEPFAQKIDSWLDLWFSNPAAAGKIFPRSLFVPAERTFFSRFINSDPKKLGDIILPLTIREFASVLTQAADIHQVWQEDSTQKPEEADFIENLLKGALGGQARSEKEHYGHSWKWLPQDSTQPIRLEMASSGQMGTWPLVFAAQAIFDEEKEHRRAFLHIEEPETHLHPGAQVAIAKLLAYLVNRGLRLVVTTHSLTLLYALNNLTLAYRQLTDQEFENTPDVQVRLDPENMTAYLFADGKIESIVDPSGQIDESLLGQTLGDLHVEFNRLMAHGTLWE